MSTNDPSSQKKKSLQEKSSDLTSESSGFTSDDEWSTEEMVRDVMRRHERTLSSLPDWSKYAVPRMDLPESVKDFDESIRKALESHCSLCKIPKSKLKRIFFFQRQNTTTAL